MCGPDDGRVRKSFARVVEQQALARHYPPEALPPPVRAAAAIKLVHAAWVDESCDAHALLPEDAYDARAPLAPRETRTLPAPPASARASAPPTSAPPPARDVSRLVSRVHSEAPGTPPPPPGTHRDAARTHTLLLSRTERFARETPGLFAHRTFSIDLHDDARTRRVASVVRSQGGILADAARATYLVRPLCAAAHAEHAAPLAAQHVVTHHWIELCLYYDTLVDPHAHLACEPTAAPMPVPLADTLRISFSGVDRDGPEYHHALAALAAIGAHVEDAFSRARTTHLVCIGDARHALKAQRAREWGIPVVDWAFLHDILRTGALPRAAAPRADAPGPLPREPAAPQRAAPAAAPAQRAAEPSARAAAEAPEALEVPDAPDAPDAEAPWDAPAEDTPHVLYDDPAARKERSRLLALVDGHAPKRARRA